jgi:hypothetical protein
MYIVNDSHRPAGAVRHDTLRKWVEVLLASERFGAAEDDIRDAAARKIRTVPQPRAE